MPHQSPEVGLVLQRSLSLDDVHGLRHAYAQGSFGRINGKIRRLSDNSVVAVAEVPRGGVPIISDGVSIMVIIGGPIKWLPPPLRSTSRGCVQSSIRESYDDFYNRRD